MKNNFVKIDGFYINVDKIVTVERNTGIRAEMYETRICYENEEFDDVKMNIDDVMDRVRRIK